MNVSRYHFSDTDVDQVIAMGGTITLTKSQVLNKMIDKLEELKKQIEKIDFTIDYGCVKITIRDGKPTLITIEKTVRLD